MPRALALGLCILGAALALLGALAPSLVLSLIDSHSLLDPNLAYRVRAPLELRCALLAFLGAALLLLASAQLELSIRAQIPATVAVLSAAFTWCWALPHGAAAANAADLVSRRPVDKAELVDAYAFATQASELVTAACVAFALVVTLYLWAFTHRIPRIIAGMTSVPATVPAAPRVPA